MGGLVYFCQFGAMIRVLVCAYSSGPLLESQIMAIRKFIPNSEIYVINDRSKNSLSGHFASRGIRAAISRQNAGKINFSQRLHRNRTKIFPASKYRKSNNPSLRHADVLQIGVQALLHHSSMPILLLDEDMIPIARPSFLTNSESALSYVSQGRPLDNPRIYYPWPGLFYFDPRKTRSNHLISWDVFRSAGQNLDTGGAMTDWLSINMNLAKEISYYRTGTWEDSEAGLLPWNFSKFAEIDKHFGGGKQFCEVYDMSFVHMRGASNWMGSNSDFVKQRLKAFIESIDEHTQNS